MADQEPKISKNREKKMQLVEKLSGKFDKAKAVVFTNYQGLTHKQIEGLKKDLKQTEAEFVVAKNSLLSRSIDSKFKLENEHQLDGPTGTLFLYNDVMSPLKALAKIIKELNLPNVKFGIMEDNFITGEQILKLSTLPPKEVLLSQLIFGLKSPILGLHRALNWNLQKLVMTLNAVAQNKPQAPASEPVEEPVAQTPAVEPAVEPEKAVESSAQIPTSEPEPETILAETPEEKAAEKPQESENSEDSKGGVN